MRKFAMAEILIMDTVLFMINNFAQRHLSTKLSINLLHSWFGKQNQLSKNSLKGENIKSDKESLSVLKHH